MKNQFITLELATKNKKEVMETKEKFRYDLITDANILDDFLMNEDSITQEMREDIVEIVYENPTFEFKKSDDELGFVLEIWETPTDYENEEEPRDSLTFWFSDYEN